MGGFIFDLDQTIVDSSIAEEFRKNRDWQKVYELIPDFTIYDGMRGLIDAIVSKGYYISIVTASPATYCQKVIEHFKLPITITVCYHDTARRKPYPDPILLASEKMGIKPNKIISIGDRDIDIIASKAASVYCIGALWGTEESERNKLISSNPNLIFNTPKELVNFLISKGRI